MNKTNRIQSGLRVGIIGIVVILVFVFGFSWVSFKAHPADIMKYLLAQVGSTIGVSMSVSENPFNTLAQQLEEKEAQLQEKEKILEQKEAILERKDFSGQSKIILGLISGLIVILLILILVNFYLDYQHRKYRKQKEYGIMS